MPAPYRYVIGRPGDPTDETESTTFGPWIQPDDQTADLSSLTFTGDPIPDPGPEFDESSYVLDPPTPDDTYPTDLNVFATGILTGFGASQGAAVALFTHETWHVMEGIAPGLGGDDDPFYFEHTLRGRRDATINALCVQLADTFWDGDWITWPDDDAVIGYEVEMAEVATDQWGPFANPVSAALDVTVAPSTYLGEALSGVVAAFALNDTWGGGDLTFDLAGLNAPERPDIDSVGTYAYEEVAVPVTGSLSPVTFNISIPDLASSPPYTGLLGLHYAIRVPITTGEPIVEVRVGVGNELEINANVSVAGVYTIRPPRIRWIYDRVPYRRTYPRDDGLAGGAPRTWPPSKVTQSSNRTFGGYL